jgi:hypothetical protein
VLALLASQRDLRPDVGGSHGGVPFYTGLRASAGRFARCR